MTEYTTASREHRLTGLEPDNLLAFLALLGLLRLLETARPGWRSRAVWDGLPLRPKLMLEEATTRKEVAETAKQSASQLAGALEFDDLKNIEDCSPCKNVQECSPEDFRKFLCLRKDAQSKNVHSYVLDVASALGSDGSVVSKMKNKIEPTPLCAITAGNKLDFPFRLKKVVEAKTATWEQIERCLFDTWRYKNDGKGITLRWDPTEDRRYAYREKNPSGDAIKTVAGANHLAVFGFPSVLVAPRYRHLSTSGFDRRTKTLTWPVWSVPLTRSGVENLLAHPEIVHEKPNIEILRLYGVRELRRARRISGAKGYTSFERASVIQSEGSR